MEELEFYSMVDGIKTELKPYLDFLQFNYNDELEKATVSLKHNIKFKEFKQYFNITKKDFVKLLDYCTELPRATYFAFKELNNIEV